jgi:hypothetical protein
MNRSQIEEAASVVLRDPRSRATTLDSQSVVCVGRDPQIGGRDPQIGGCDPQIGGFANRQIGGYDACWGQLHWF